MFGIPAKQLVRYVITGTIAFFVFIAVYGFALHLGISHRSATIAAAIPTWIGKFILHKWWTFEEKDPDKVPVEAVPYTVVVLGTFGLVIVLSWLFQAVMLLPVVLADLVAGGLIIAVRFILTRLIFVRNLRPL